MTALIAFPFRLSTTGTVVTVEQGTEDYYSQQIAVILRTYLGERVLEPDFGVPVMEFYEFGRLALTQACNQYLPEIEISDVAASYASDAEEDVTVTFNIIGAET